MKNIFYLFLIIAMPAFAQPGDNKAFRASRIEDITKALKHNPNNYELIWERIELIFDPDFNMLTRPYIEVPNDHLFEESWAFSYKNIDVLTEINRLIDKSPTIDKTLGRRENAAYFYYKRGQYYYLKNQKEAALSDYLMALKSNSDNYIKNRICISIVAYYYNLDDVPKQENLVHALEYIDIVTPIEHEKSFRELNYNDTNGDIFENEKILLLKALNNKERLVNYFKNNAKSYIKLYIKTISTYEALYSRRTSDSFTEQQLERGLSYLNRLAEYYNEIGETQNAKNVYQNIYNLRRNIEALFQQTTQINNQIDKM